MLVVIYLVSQLWRSNQVTAKVQVDSAHCTMIHSRNHRHFPGKKPSLDHHRFCKQHRRPVNVWSLAVFFPHETWEDDGKVEWLCLCVVKLLQANNGHPGFSKCLRKLESSWDQIQLCLFCSVGCSYFSAFQRSIGNENSSKTLGW